jgi:hypothetical protein
MLLRSLREHRWQAAFRASYPALDSAAPETGRLRLILGAGRSGTSWVSQVLFQTTTRCRCFSEPLFHIAPRLPFYAKGDHTAVNYEVVSPGHPLLRAYELLLHRPFDGSNLHGASRNDPGWEICLVKEVHALLGVEGLLRAWSAPSVFILRDPLYVADSLFAAQTVQTNYLDHECDAVRRRDFLHRFAPGREAVVERLLADAARRESRQKIILRKVVCIQLLQKMFSVLAAEFPCARVLSYEQLCEAPDEGFRTIANALAIPWDRAMEGYLAKTTQPDETSGDPYSVMRKTSEQTHRPFKFLSAEEVELCRAAADEIRIDR